MSRVRWADAERAQETVVNGKEIQFGSRPTLVY